ncbi:hypothetical protein ACO0QE_003700 [Hanseniaspora vineae]
MFPRREMLMLDTYHKHNNSNLFYEELEDIEELEKYKDQDGFAYSHTDDEMLNALYSNFTNRSRVDMPYVERTESFKPIIQDSNVPESFKYSDENIEKCLEELDYLPWNNLKEFSSTVTDKYDFFGVVVDRLNAIKFVAPFNTDINDKAYNSRIILLNLTYHLKYHVSCYRAFRSAHERMQSYVDFLKLLNVQKDEKMIATMNKAVFGDTALRNSLNLIRSETAFAKYKYSWELLQLWMNQTFEATLGCTLLIEQKSLQDIKADLNTNAAAAAAAAATFDNFENSAEAFLNAKDINKVDADASLKNNFDFEFSEKNCASTDKHQTNNEKNVDEAYDQDNEVRSSSDPKYRSRDPPFRSASSLSNDNLRMNSAQKVEFLMVRPSASEMFGLKLALDEPNIKITDYELVMNNNQKVSSPEFFEAKDTLTPTSMSKIDYDDYILNVMDLPKNKSFDFLQRDLTDLLVSYDRLQTDLKRLQDELFQLKLRIDEHHKKSQLIHTSHSVKKGININIDDQPLQQSSEKQVLLEQKITSLIRTINKVSLKINSALLAQKYSTSFSNYTKVKLSPEIANFLYKQELKDKYKQILLQEQQSRTNEKPLELNGFEKTNKLDAAKLRENYTKSSLITKIPFLEESFHYVSIPGIWDTIPFKKWEPLAKEAYRVLKPKGVLYTPSLDFQLVNLHAAKSSDFKTSREKQVIYDEVFLQAAKSGHQLAPTRYLTQVLYKAGFKNVQYTILSLKLGDFQSDMGKNHELIFLILFMLFFMNMKQEQNIPNIDSFVERYMHEHENLVDPNAGSLRVVLIKAFKE